MMLDNNLIEQIHRREGKCIITATGGGTTAISRLLEIPGASNTLLSAFIPYHEDELNVYLGGVPDQACSSETARAMAMTAWQRAREIERTVPVFGIGCTAALSTNRERRGDDRCYVAVQCSDSTLVVSATFDKSRSSRAEEEKLCSQLILGAIAEALGLDCDYLADFRKSDVVSTHKIVAKASWQALMEGVEYSAADAVHTDQDHSAQPTPTLVFPGAFNPLHRGHDAMARYAEKCTGERVTLEISVFNVDKPPLDYIEMKARQDSSRKWPLVFTNAPTFIEKCRLFPGARFIVGSDTLLRVADKKYYGGSEAEYRSALNEIEELGNRFMVFGRQSPEGFVTLSDLEIPTTLARLCTPVNEDEFREDISSSSIRARRLSEDSTD